MEQDRTRQTGSIDVHETVVVIVGGCDAHAERCHVDPAWPTHIREVQRSLPVGAHDQIISKKTIPEWTSRRIGRVLERLLAEHRTLNQVHIEVAVVVVIEQRDAGRHDLRVVLFAGHAVEVDEVEADLRGAFGEPLCVSRS